MKTIGFIDYFLDEWHANNYPAWIDQASGGKAKVAYAYGKIDSPREGGLKNAEWADKYGIPLLGTIEEVVEKSDCLIVLSPDNPEFHEELAELPLQSGKPLYIDKTFAPDSRIAAGLFESARRHGTAMWSSSALRFASEFLEAEREGIRTIASWGPGTYEHYSVHQIEPIVSLMGSGPQRVMWIGTEQSPSMLIDYGRGRLATLHHFGWDSPFRMNVGYASGQTLFIQPESDYFAAFVRALLDFFETGKPAVDEAQTMAVIRLIEYGRKASETPFEWVMMP